MTTAKMEEAKIHVIAYSSDHFLETTLDSVAELAEVKDKYSVLWADVDGGLTAPFLEQMGAIFQFHELALEDALNFKQRAKTEDYEDYLFIVSRMINPRHLLDSEQLCIFLGPNYVITFQEKTGGDCLSGLRDRLRKGAGRIRKLGADYLAYLIVDAVVDSYFPILEELGEQIETLEDEILEKPDSTAPSRIHNLKREIIAIRRTIWPLRDSIYSLCRDSHPLISDNTRVYLRDCYDHALRLMDVVETYREIGHDLMDIYLSTVNNRMNEIMKVLTIITTLFIPPTFIAGIYGMNFNTAVSPWNMPELHWFYGYPFALALMVTIAALLTYYLFRRGWLKNSGL
jgi:magnesium transporter